MVTGAQAINPLWKMGYASRHQLLIADDALDYVKKNPVDMVISVSTCQIRPDLND